MNSGKGTSIETVCEEEERMVVSLVATSEEVVGERVRVRWERMSWVRR